LQFQDDIITPLNESQSKKRKPEKSHTIKVDKKTQSKKLKPETTKEDQSKKEKNRKTSIY